MKKLIILRGIQAAGKSSFIRNNKLEEHTVSSDKLRILASGYSLTNNHVPKINDRDGAFVWSTLMAIVKNRMENQLLTFIDATHCKNSYLTQYSKMCEEYNYELCLIDFEVSLEDALARNKTRPPAEHIPEIHVTNFYNNLQLSKKNPVKDVRYLSQANWKQEILSEYIVDVSHYENVNIFGDEQGCQTPTDEFFTQRPYTQSDFYIFVGDYVDRGLENLATVKFCLSHYKQENMFFCEGNHEFHLDNWASGKQVFSEEFKNYTQPQLESGNVNKAKVKNFCRSLKEFMILKYGDKKILVSHCGVSAMPTDDELLFVSGLEFTYKRDYKFPVDSEFDKNAKENEYQFHGHRNPENKENVDQVKSFSLEDKVEYSGYLRVAIINKQGIEFIKIKNHISKYGVDEAKIKELASSPLIREKELANGVFSYNFNRDAFFKREWNELTTRARGLFIHKESKVIVARSYDKFFNVNEFENTKIENLTSMKFPVKAYLKENGFLGILGYSPVTNELLFCSKSTNEGDFAGYFKTMFMNKYADKVDDLLVYLRDRKCSFIFEVVDIENDPHVVPYTESQLVLLDIVHNEMVFKNVDYKNLVKNGKRFGFQVKELVKILNNYEELLAFYNETKADDYQYDGRYVEGFVLEDSDSYMVKIKCQYYNFWKRIRQYCHRVSTGTIAKSYPLMTEKEKPVVAFVIEHQLQEKNVIEIAEKYYNQKK